MNKATIEYIKHIPILGILLEKIHTGLCYFDMKRGNIAEKFGLINMKHLSVFCPNSSGATSLRTKLTTLSANQTIPLIGILLNNIHQLDEPKIYSIEEFCKAIGVTEIESLSEEIREKFTEYGSDKSSVHNYHLLYASILKNKNKITGLLEIGLGTNNTKVASNMGTHGKPGASLRAFRDYLPNAIIYGADFDKNILFDEERIKTFFVDQTRLNTFEFLHHAIKDKLDVIIDDGLHAPNANLATLIFALRKMKDNKSGVVIIEDIPEKAIPLWKIIDHMIPNKRHQTYMVKTMKAYAFVCIKVSIKTDNQVQAPFKFRCKYPFL